MPGSCYSESPPFANRFGRLRAGRRAPRLSVRGRAQAQAGFSLHEHRNIGPARAAVEANVLIVHDLLDLGTWVLGKLLNESVDNLVDGTFFVDLFHM